jgi:hypothetical protein
MRAERPPRSQQQVRRGPERQPAAPPNATSATQSHRSDANTVQALRGAQPKPGPPGVYRRSAIGGASDAQLTDAVVTPALDRAGILRSPFSAPGLHEVVPATNPPPPQHRAYIVKLQQPLDPAGDHVSTSQQPVLHKKHDTPIPLII